jgi:hypothetical protein
MTEQEFMTQAEARQRTMRLQAMRKLSKTELHGLGIGLGAITALEAVLVTELMNMRDAAEKETAVRRARALPTLGPYGRAYLATRRALCAVGLALEDTGAVVEQGKI